MTKITREKISAIRAYYSGPHKEALRYMVISDILYDALPALLDIAEKVIAEPSDPKPTSDLLSRLASAQGEASAQRPAIEGSPSFEVGTTSEPPRT